MIPNNSLEGTCGMLTEIQIHSDKYIGDSFKYFRIVAHHEAIQAHPQIVMPLRQTT